MIPFMDTSHVVGPISKAMDGADISFYVGFVVGAVVYWPLRKIESRGTVTSAFEASMEPADVKVTSRDGL
jgi:purine-cytosine permease-like protein